MNLRRSQRMLKPVTIWKEKDVPSITKDSKITKKSTHTEKKTVLKPIAVEPLLNVIKLDKKRLSKLSTYISPFELRYQTSKSLTTDLSELDMF